MPVLIVSRTRMKGGVCIGGISVEGHANVRLLPSSGGHSHPASAPFRIGQLWNLDLKTPATIVPPHVEDMLVEGARPAGELEDVAGWLGRNTMVVSGDVSVLFDGLLRVSHAGTAYIGENGVPRSSVGFWRPSSDLRADDPGQHYLATHGLREVTVKYVGEAPASPVIPAGSLVRVSLARWFSPSGSDWTACWLQLSGWYPVAGASKSRREP